MLPICLGEASKTAAFMLDADKTYEARARLGEATATGDLEGEILRREAVPALGAEDIPRAMAALSGEIRQVPPMYSALKHQGQPLYKLARAGQAVEREARSVTIHAFELLAWNPPDLEFRVRCSKGTYVRTLAEDLAAALATCAHLQALRRTASGPFDGGMVTLEELEERVQAGTADALLLPPDAGLADWPVVTLAAAAAERFAHGNPVAAPNQAPGPARVYSEAGILLGLAEVTSEKVLKPKRIMNLVA